ncbi:hypothetical protein TUM12370_18610 [Salmonella enterica subsp. enterica serovar Choleraesuis]|nr:hypothetical protein TUM12370_18610 [Salmonella enterica subsp. enterica serovar Choleraesuis]
MVLSREFIRNNRILFGIGALLLVGGVGAAETTDNPVKQDGSSQTQPPRAPASTTKDLKSEGLKTTPPAVSSSHDISKHGVSGDPTLRPQKAKKPHDAVKNGATSVDDDVSP